MRAKLSQSKNINTPVTIEVAASVHFFQKRFSWMCSSILQQKNVSLENIVVNAAYMENSGKPTTKEVLDYYESQGLRVKHTPYPDTKTLQFRGIVRNRAIEETECTHILFADADMVYPPTYFRDLIKLLETKYKDNPGCMFSGRNSTILEPTEDLINQFKYPYLIPNAFKRASELPSIRRSNIGAGYCQIIDVAQVKEKWGGIYVDPEKNKDWSWERRYQKAHSDKQFRQKVGRVKLPLPRQIHLQHVRDKEVGKHIEIQR